MRTREHRPAVSMRFPARRTSAVKVVGAVQAHNLGLSNPGVARPPARQYGWFCGHADTAELEVPAVTETDKERAERHERERKDANERYERERMESHTRHEEERKAAREQRDEDRADSED